MGDRRKKWRKGKLGLGDLRAEVMHAAQQPYIRMFDFDFWHDKKYVKEMWKKEARLIGSGTHYVLENELLDVIISSMKRSSIRRFINAFWNARPPHNNFFIEYDVDYLLNHLDQEEAIPRSGVVTAALGGISVRQRRNPANTYNEARDMMTSTGKWKKLIMPHCHELMFHTAQCSEENETKLVHTSPSCLQIIAPEDYEKRMGVLEQAAGQEGPDFAEKNREAFFNGHTFFEDMFGLADSEPAYTCKDYDGLWDVAKLCNVVMHTSYNIDGPQCAMDFRTPSKHLKGHEIISLQVYMAAVSLLNYYWVVNKEDGIVARGTRNINTEAFPRDLYKRVTINLPKDKAIAEFKKQKARIRKFGTAEHTVRGHWRFYKKSGERIWITEHSRGDEKYGTVHKDYILTKRDGYLKPTIKK